MSVIFCGPVRAPTQLETVPATQPFRDWVAEADRVLDCWRDNVSETVVIFADSPPQSISDLEVTNTIRPGIVYIQANVWWDFAVATEISLRDIEIALDTLAEASIAIIDELERNALAVEEQTQTLVNSIVLPIEEDLQAAEQQRVDITILLNDFIDTTINLADDISEGIGQIIADVLVFITDLVFTSIELVSNAILDTIEAEFTILDGFLQDISDGILEVADNQLVIADTLAEEIQNLTGELPAEFDKIFRSIGDDLLINAGGIFDELITVFLDRFRGKFDEILDDLDAPAREVMENLFSAIKTDKELSPITTILTGHVLHNPLPIAGVILTIVGGFLLNWFLSAATGPEQAIVAQTHSRAVAWNILPLPELIAAKRREIITEEGLKHNAGGLGFSDESIDIAQQADLLQIDASTALTWWLREFTTDEQLSERLTRLGFNNEDQANLRKAAKIIPPTVDLIRFAVREVFSPAIRAKFKMDEDFPEEFAKQAAQQGLTKEVAGNYWAAHWELPSVLMGFQMMHRSLISPDELSDLLRAKDVMPFWRDKIKGLAFRLFTRVDIRRMHKLGVLTDVEVLTAYRELGFDDDKAEKQQQFVLELNKPDEFVPNQTIEQTFLEQTTNLFTRGVLSKEESNDLLIAYGFNTDAIAAFLTNVEIENDLKARDDAENKVIELAVAGIIDFPQAEERLHKIGFETTEVGQILNKIIDKREIRVKIPSLETLNSMLKKKIITKDEYVLALENSGFSPMWSHNLLSLLEN